MEGVLVKPGLAEMQMSSTGFVLLGESVEISR